MEETKVKDYLYDYKTTIKKVVLKQSITQERRTIT